MQAMIDNLLYDTDTAVRILPQPLGGVAVYRTKKGRWFLFRKAEMGPAWSINPITDKEAKIILWNHAELYAKYFEKPQEA